LHALLRPSCLFSTHPLSLTQQLVTPMPLSSLFSHQFSHQLHHSTHYSLFSAPALPHTFPHSYSLPCSFLFCSSLTLFSGGGRGDQRGVRSPGPHPYPPRASVYSRPHPVSRMRFIYLSVQLILHSHYLLHTTAAATVLAGHFSSHRIHYTHYTSPFPLTPLQQPQHQRGTYLNSISHSAVAVRCSQSPGGPMNPACLRG
jgi:hypothetical protein